MDRILACPYYADVYARAERIGSHAVEALLQVVSRNGSMGSFAGMEYHDCDLRVGFDVASFAAALDRRESELVTADTSRRGNIQDQMRFTALLSQHAHEFTELFGSFGDGWRMFELAISAHQFPDQPTEAKNQIYEAYRKVLSYGSRMDPSRIRIPAYLLSYISDSLEALVLPHDDSRRHHAELSLQNLSVALLHSVI